MSSFYLIILYLTSRWAIVLPFLVQLFPVRGKLQTQIRLRLSDPHSQGSLLLVTVPMLPAPPGFGLTTLMASDTKTNAATRINPVSKCFVSFILNIMDLFSESAETELTSQFTRGPRFLRTCLTPFRKPHVGKHGVK